MKFKHTDVQRERYTKDKLIVSHVYRRAEDLSQNAEEIFTLVEIEDTKYLIALGEGIGIKLDAIDDSVEFIRLTAILKVHDYTYE